MTRTLTQQQQQIVDKVKALREYTEKTGFRTTKTQNDLIQSLRGDDFATVILALKQQ